MKETKVTPCMCYACTGAPTDEQVARAKAYWAGKTIETAQTIVSSDYPQKAAK